MSKINKIKLDNLIHQLGLEYGLPDEVVRNIAESQFEFTAEKIKEFDFSSLNSSEDLKDMKTVFLFKGLGKLFINPKGFDNYLRRMKKRK